MGYKEVYESWLSNPYFDDATKAELKGIANDEKEIEERFYTELEFGTAGLRGVIDHGPPLHRDTFCGDCPHHSERNGQ